MRIVGRSPSVRNTVKSSSMRIIGRSPSVRNAEMGSSV